MIDTIIHLIKDVITLIQIIAFFFIAGFGLTLGFTSCLNLIDWLERRLK